MEAVFEALAEIVLEVIGEIIEVTINEIRYSLFKL